MMRSILYFAVGFLALSGVALFFQGNEQVTLQSQDKSTFKKYVAWKNEHNKNTNGEEDKYRFEVFSENLKRIISENKKSTTLTLGMTQFADLTNSEFRAIYTTEITTPKMDYIQVLQTSDSMESIDWVQKGAVTSVKNQGSCGSCWAFSTTAGLEGLEAIQTGNLVSLSDQQVTSCVPAPFSLGCNGGNPLFGYIYTSRTGIETNAAYPYVQENDSHTAACNYEQSKVEFQNQLVGQVPPNSPPQMNAALQIQPLSVAVDAGSFAFQTYSSGVLDSPNCKDQLNHAITLVGYTSSDNSWTVKNSWGTGWGNQGYAKIANQPGNGVCGINMDLSYPTPTTTQ